MPTRPRREHTVIDEIAEAWLDTQLDLYPEERVYLGRPGREGEYGDHSPDGHRELVREASKARTALTAAEASDEVDTVTKAELARELRLLIDKEDAGFPQRDLNVIASPAQELREIFDLSPTATEDDWAVIAKRLRNLPAAMDGYLRTLRSGIESGAVPAVRQVREVAAQAEDHAAPAGFFGELAANARAGDAELPQALRSELAESARRAAEAYALLGEFLRTELAPHARREDAVGRELYAIASRGFLGAEVDLDETYDWGVAELARMRAEHERTARQLVPGGTVADAVRHLETDPARRLHGTEALRAWMQRTSDEAIAALSSTHFDIPDELTRLECMIAPTHDGGIYYTAPADDFSRPGRMWWSVPAGVTDFSTWRERTTVYHEGVPGHHLQLGHAAYNKDALNSWRRIAMTSGHAEGWALYAERLMEELGYLDDPGDRFGMLDGQRMRAARVVIDIGVHLGKPMPDGSGPWTGEAAFAFLADNVDMDAAFVRFEVNRYLGWPGQAPSYKIGQRVWEQLRDECRRRDPAGFDIRAFHAKALDLGGLGLDTLRMAMLG